MREQQVSHRLADDAGCRRHLDAYQLQAALQLQQTLELKKSQAVNLQMEFDGMQKNSSVIQPDTLHADTHGQSEPVFGLSRVHPKPLLQYLV